MRTILTKALIALAITTVAAFGADNTLGTWKLDVAQSKYTPAPFPLKTLTDTRNQTVGRYHGTSNTVVSNGGKTMTTTTKGTNADGKEFTSTFVFDKQ